MANSHTPGSLAAAGGFVGNLTGNVTGNIAGNLTAGASTVALTLVKTGTVAVDPASLLTATLNETAVTITGAAVGDIVIMNPPSALEATLAFAGAYVSATNTVKVRLANISAGTVDGASASWTYTLLRFA